MTILNVSPIFAPIYGVLLPNASYERGITTALGTGDTDLYTCPAGKRALIKASAARISGLNAAGNVTAFLEVKISSTYYRISSNFTVTNTQTGVLGSGDFILEAGEILAINCATSTGASVFYDIIEFDNTAALKTKYKTSPSTGDNTLYTVPANTSAFILSQALVLGSGVVAVTSDSGGTRTWKAYTVPSGQSTGLAYQTSAASAITASTVGTVAGVVATLTAGDFVSINVDTGNAAQIAWINYVESLNT